MCAGPLLIWRKGPQTWSDRKAEILMQTAVGVCYIPVSHPTCWGQRSCSLGTSPCPVLCPLWQWLLLDPSRCPGLGGLLEQHFSILQAEQHPQCLPRTATVWVGVLIPLQSLPPLAKSAASRAQPSFPWSQAAFLPPCPSGHLNFCVCWSSFQSSESISVVALLETKHNQDRIFFLIFQR